MSELLKAHINKFTAIFAGRVAGSYRFFYGRRTGGIGHDR